MRAALNAPRACKVPPWGNGGAGADLRALRVLRADPIAGQNALPRSLPIEFCVPAFPLASVLSLATPQARAKVGPPRTAGENFVELLLLLGVVGLVASLFFVLSSAKKASDTQAVGPGPEAPRITAKPKHRSDTDPDDWLSESTFKNHMAFLEARWEAAESSKEAEDGAFPPWFHEPASERQLHRLHSMGIATRRQLTKGQASDLIGLGEESGDHEREVLKFFKVPLRDLNETTAREEVRKIFADPENREKWKHRPATTKQKECIRFFGEKVPKGLKAEDARRRIGELADKYPEKEKEWDNFQCIVDDINDKDFREDMEMKKPSKKTLQEAVDTLTAEGKALRDLDPDEVAQKILDLHPELMRD